MMPSSLKRMLVMRCAFCGDDTLDFEYIPQMHLLVCPDCFDFDTILRNIIKEAWDNMDEEDDDGFIK